MGKDAAAVTAEKTPRAKPQMTRLAPDDPRFIEWRIKLGILLKQELAPNPDGNQLPTPGSGRSASCFKANC